MREGVVRCFVVLAALVLLGATIRDTARVTRRLRGPRVVAGADQDSRRWTCLEEELRRKVPPGSTVKVAYVSPLDYQRLTEMSTSWFRVGDGSYADYAVWLERGGHCFDQQVIVLRTR